MTDSAVPALVGERYELGELLGQGGMAQVYSGMDRRLARPVAVKLLRPHMAARDDIRARFESEAQSAAQLSHPAAVAVYDTGEHDGTPYIVMERLPGETLADRIAAGPVDQEWLKRTAVEVLGALGAAHAAGLVHRDVKPGNILLTSDGHAKIADFGIAKSIEKPASGGLDLTGTGQLVGTPAYLAPERIEGRPADAHSDLYALGVVLYEALAGAKPFQGDTPIATAGKVVTGRYRPLRELRPDADPRFVEVIERAMARNPKDRFASAAEMAAALTTDVSPQHDATMVAAPPAGDTMLLDYAPAGDDTPERPIPRLAPRRRPELAWLVVLAGLAVLAFLILSQMVGGDDEGRTTPTTASTVASPYADLISDLREFADSLSPDDGTRFAELADRLHGVADALEAGNGGPAATDLAADVRRWNRNNELTDGTTADVLQLLARVPGATVTSRTAPPRTTAVPTTQPPTVPTTTETTLPAATLPPIELPPFTTPPGGDGNGNGEEGRTRGNGRE